MLCRPNFWFVATSNMSFAQMSLVLDATCLVFLNFRLKLPPSNRRTGPPSHRFDPFPPALFSFYLIFLLLSFSFSLCSLHSNGSTKCDGSRGPFTSLSSPLGYHPPIFCTLPPFMLLPPSVIVPFSVVPLLSASFSFNHHVVLGTSSFGAFLLSTLFCFFPVLVYKFPAHTCRDHLFH